MAIAKPVRGLALISLLLLTFLIYLVSKSPPQVNGPGDLEHEMPNDPMNDGGISLLAPKRSSDGP